jgi:sporulation protein YlmC with PRC-barrel domain
MKKLALFAILGFFVVFAAYAVAQSEETTTVTQQPSTTSEKTVVTKDGEVIATIEKVDVPTKTITVKTEKNGETKTYTYTTKTSWGTKDKIVKVEDLKTGDVVYLNATPENVISRITVKTVTTDNPEQPPQQ